MLLCRLLLALSHGLRLFGLSTLCQLLLEQGGLAHEAAQQGERREFFVPVEFRRRQLLKAPFEPSDLVGAGWCSVDGYVGKPWSDAVEGPKVDGPSTEQDRKSTR